MSWALFDVGCLHVPTEVIYRATLDRLPKAISERCKALVDEGWVVNSRGEFYHHGLGPSEMSVALGAGSDAPGAYGRIVDTGGEWKPQFLEECAPGYRRAVGDSVQEQTGVPYKIPDVPGPTPWEGIPGPPHIHMTG